MAQNKVLKAYRQCARVVELIEASAKALGCSEADVVDRCVVNELGHLLRVEMAKPSPIPDLVKAAEQLHDEIVPQEEPRIGVRKHKQHSGLVAGGGK